MKLFVKVVLLQNLWKSFTIFKNGSITDILQGPKCASEHWPKNFKKLVFIIIIIIILIIIVVLNRIQDGQFRGCWRMGGGGKKTPSS